MQTSPEPPGFANTALIFDSPDVKNLPSPHSLIRGQLGEHLPGAAHDLVDGHDLASFSGKLT